MIEEAIILAGGFGTRLREVVAQVPKPIAPVAGQPFLSYILRYLGHFGIKSVVLSIGYQGENIRELYGNAFNGMDIRYAEEAEPLGTGGGIRFALQKTTSRHVLVLNGDTFFDVGLQDLQNFHAAKNADVTLVLRKMERPDRYGTVVLDENARIIKFLEKQKGLDMGLINGGTYLLSRDVFSKVGVGSIFSIENDFFKPFVGDVAMFGFESDGYFIDIGIPEDYYKANETFRDFRY